MRKRKLIAILFSDIEGYTKIMQEDETKASLLITKFRKEMEEKTVANAGEIIHFYGDGCLAIFDSSVDALHCALALQQSFLTNPGVPVRIGLHTGDAYFEADSVYGDSVNIASRIESLGTAGAVLFSQRINKDVENQADFHIRSLGSFEFKNVKKPMAVFALANEPLVIPKRKNIKGKLKEKSTNYFSYISLLLLASILAISSFFWYNQQKVATSTEPKKVREFKEKSVAVMAFENLSGITDLKYYGLMASDWITQGLMEGGANHVINTSNVRHTSQFESLDYMDNTEIAEQTGIEILIRGRFYVQEGQLVLNASITNSLTGETIYSGNKTGDRETPLQLLEEISQDILGHWAVADKKRYEHKVPKYAAYQEYLKGGESYFVNKRKSIGHFRKAWALDTSFYEPLLGLAGIYRLVGREYWTDSLITMIKLKNPPLKQWEKWRLACLDNAMEGKYSQAAVYLEKMFNMDPSDQVSNYQLGYYYLCNNQPQKAIAALQTFDKKYENKQEQVDLRTNYLVLANLNLGNYEKVLELAKGYDYPIIYSLFAINHLKALIRLRQYDELSKQLDIYQNSDIPGYFGKPPWLVTFICFELYNQEEEVLLQEYATKLIEWAELYKSKGSYDYFRGIAYFFLEDFQQSLNSFEQELVNFPGNLSQFQVIGNIGACYANLGQPQKALAQIERINNHQRPDYQGARVYAHATIYSAVGQHEKAIETLKEAKRLGKKFRPWTYKESPFLKPLFENPAFKELVAFEE